MIPLLAVALLGLLSGCASTPDTYPTVCDTKVYDKNGPGYTRMQFPCKLEHREGQTP